MALLLHCLQCGGKHLQVSVKGENYLDYLFLIKFQFLSPVELHWGYWGYLLQLCRSLWLGWETHSHRLRSGRCHCPMPKKEDLVPDNGTHSRTPADSEEKDFQATEGDTGHDIHWVNCPLLKIILQHCWEWHISNHAAKWSTSNQLITCFT